MGRYCGQCDEYRSSSSYSSNQWRKGEGYSRCASCVHPPPPPVQYYWTCQVCNRDFDTENQLNMHSQVHRPKTVACPVCGDERFGSGANAVQHVESGYCRGCKGQDNARQQIYKFASSKAAMRPYLNNVPMITSGNNDYNAVPDFPYECNLCSKSFRQLSQLLQHQDGKHNNRNLLLH